MYLSAKHFDKARNIVMNFEIAYRSYISSLFLNAVTSDIDFKNSLDNIISSISSSTIIMSGFLKSKATNIKGKYMEVYNDLIFANDCFSSKTIIKKHDVPDVSEIVSITYLYSHLFQDLIKCFKTPSEFIQLSDLFHDKRNKLCHTGSELIDEEDVFDVLCFVSTVLDFLDNSYFWFKSKKIIYDDIDNYLNIETENSIKTNTSEMPFSNHKIICREEQLKIIDDFVIGKPEYYKKSTTMCIYGYGGIGKTALALEYVRTFLKNISDKKYSSNPIDFILFFSAKDVILKANDITGKVETSELKQGFKTSEELKNSIYNALGITSFSDYNRKGLIIVDNFEVLDKKEKEGIRIFIKNQSPLSISYIVTSRNPEKLEETICIQEFNHIDGINFIDSYANEANIDIDLSSKDKKDLINLSKGNTLVILLSLHRLNSRNATMLSIQGEFTQLVNINKIKNELSVIPPNAYEIISEFMYRNTFDELVGLLTEELDLLVYILKIFAIIDEDIEIYTLSRVTNKNFREVEYILDILCNYLIIQKKGEYYSINQFANKYIVDRFISNSIELEKLSREITTIRTAINNDLKNFNTQINASSDVMTIINDWNIELFGDKLLAAKAFSIYGEIKHSLDKDCSPENYFIVNCLEELEKLLKITIHPYLSFQKARIMCLFIQYDTTKKEFINAADSSYLEAIQVIKWNYPQIKATKSYASVLWLYGIFLYEQKKHEAIRYLEDALEAFKHLSIYDDEYYQCFSYLGNAYLNEYENKRDKTYLRKSREISIKLKNERNKYTHSLWKHSFDLAERLRPYGTY